MENVEYKEFMPEEHLPGILALCEAEGWESFVRDPELALDSLTASGVSTIVAVENGSVVGFAQIQSDGVPQGHLSSIAVEETRRGRGIGKALVLEAFERSGGERVDLVSAEEDDKFYESFAHKPRQGYRIYPRVLREA